MKLSRLALLPLATLAFATAAHAGPAPTHLVATFAQKPGAKALTYSNLDVTKVVTTTIKTPIYVAVVTPVYTIVQQPVYNSHHVQIGTKSVKVQTGTVTTQKITGYTTTTTKAATITPSSKIFTKTGTATYGVPIAATATINLPTKGPFTAPVTGKQNAMLTISTASTVAPIVSGYTFSQAFGAGSLLLARTVAVRAVGANGKAYGPATKQLLHINWTNAVLTGNTQTNLWSLTGDNALGGLTFTSDFFKTSAITSMAAFEFSFGGLATALGVAPTDPSYTTVTGRHSLASFTSNVAGSVLSSAVPEPATWAMMILGMGAIGVSLRRRRAAGGALRLA